MVLVCEMIYKYSELLKKRIYNSDIEIKRAINDDKLFKIDFGLYSDKKINLKLEIISKKYENYIFNSESAFFYNNIYKAFNISYGNL